MKQNQEYILYIRKLKLKCIKITAVSIYQSNNVGYMHRAHLAEPSFACVECSQLFSRLSLAERPFH